MSVVVVAWTRGAEGWAALLRGAEEARLRGARLSVFGDVPEQVLSRLSAEAGDVPVSTETIADGETRDLPSRVIDASYEDDVVLVAVGMRRRSPIGKMLVGDLAQRILLEAHCSVLAVKPPAGA
ncbi:MULTISPECIES: universal stress protein [Catenuloplanes]|uniref:Nucleotide-binding universal stress UspA family protein n=1 Tax=Catenuloplanes niger TaxID=587534 RepID=A0AAE3ZHF9_9ACTN|nr:universal stress protein [Catenuloplanes niger]MDR7319983.1 nucleotide-binding universal stress UspA family protein [Catenuloplanes niger]